MGKGIEVTNDMLIKRNKDLRCRYNSPLIKWYAATISKEEKYKLGLMTYDEYMEWQEELANKSEEPEDIDTPESSDEPEPSDASTETDEVQHTFWENDDGDRKNVSSDSYSEFLSENGVDVRNANAFDVDQILNENRE